VIQWTFLYGWPFALFEIGIWWAWSGKLVPNHELNHAGSPITSPELSVSPCSGCSCYHWSIKILFGHNGHFVVVFYVEAALSWSNLQTRFCWISCPLMLFWLRVNALGLTWFPLSSIGHFCCVALQAKRIKNQPVMPHYCIFSYCHLVLLAPDSLMVM